MIGVTMRSAFVIDKNGTIQYAEILEDAGKQPNYDAIRIQKKYYHLRGEGLVTKSDIQIRIHGQDVDSYSTPLYRFSGQHLDYYYLDFKIHPGSVF
jgi:hypothetical protein